MNIEKYWIMEKAEMFLVLSYVHVPIDTHLHPIHVVKQAEHTTAMIIWTS